MHLYNLSLVKPTAITQAVYGSFSGPKTHEFAVIRGTTLELLRPHADTLRIETIQSTEAFGVLRCVQPLRFLGQNIDHLLVTSDSGNMSVLLFHKERNEWQVAHNEAFGKSGVRRISPGQYLAREPHGRAFMVAALEKQKLVYVLNRAVSSSSGSSAAANSSLSSTSPLGLTISSPLEAHKSRVLLFDVIGLDNGFDNPIFACLELDYTDSDVDVSGESIEKAQKTLSYYELDLGINHVVKKWSRETDRGANMLIPVPGDADGPGGCLVLCENWILYEHNVGAGSSSTAPAPVRTAIPRRTDMPDSRGLLLVSWTMHKSKSGFFFLVQSELGDLYKVTLVLSAPVEAVSGVVPRRSVADLVVKYFDTIPTSNSLCLTRSGLLFAAAEFGNHMLFQFQSLGEDDDTAATSRAVASADSVTGVDVNVVVPVFAPRALRNLIKADESLSLAPITDMRVFVPSTSSSVASSAGAPQILALCGRGTRSSLRVLRQGLGANELAVSAMPGSPISVFTLKAPGAYVAAAAAAASATAAAAGNAAAQALAAAATASAASSAQGQPDRYIVLSFTNATVVLSVGSSVEEIPAKDIGFVETVPTILAGILVDGSFIQVYPSAIRMVAFDAATGAKGPSREWKPQGLRVIVRAAMNSRQLIIALSGGEVKYFEFDAASRGLKDMSTTSLGAEVTAVAIGPVPDGRVRNSFCAISDTGLAVRVLCLDPGKNLSQSSSQSLRAGVESLAIVSIKVHGSSATPHLFIGLQNGVLSRLSLDERSGVLSDPRVRFLGLRPVKLVQVRIAGAPALMALSSRAFVVYNLHGRFLMQPVSLDSPVGNTVSSGGVVLEHSSAFATESLPEAFVAVAGTSLRIFTLDRLNEPFSARTLPFRYTPRRMAFHMTTGLIAVVEADHNSFNKAERRSIAMKSAESHPQETSLAGLPSFEVLLAKKLASTKDIQEGSMEVDSTSNDIDLTNDGQEANETNVNADLFEGLDPHRIGAPLPEEQGKWASCIRLVDSSLLTSSSSSSSSSSTSFVDHHATHHVLELSDNEAALSVATASFHDLGDEQFVFVGVAQGLSFHPRKHKSCSIHTYQVIEAPRAVNDVLGSAVSSASNPMSSSQSVSKKFRLQLVHKTPVEDLPLALTAFQGRLLVGVGRTLRLYDMGKKRLLRKCELKNAFPTGIQNIQISLDRAVVSDQQESIHFVKYRQAGNALTLFADDTIMRHMTCALVLDHDTIIGADKFGSVFVLRLPAEVSDMVDGQGLTMISADASSSLVGGAANKVVQIAHFYVGSVVTSLQKAVLAVGSTEVVLYTTVHGGLGALSPLTDKGDVDLFTRLELAMRNEQNISLVGRDHLSFRSSFAPVSHVIDGDLIEAFSKLSFDRQKIVAGTTDRTPAEVSKKMEDLRNRMT
jgi:splicing factor 3B subunit 3